MDAARKRHSQSTRAFHKLNFGLGGKMDFKENMSWAWATTGYTMQGRQPKYEKVNPKQRLHFFNSENQLDKKYDATYGYYTWRHQGQHQQAGRFDSTPT
jgi:hypothetical protein